MANGLYDKAREAFLKGSLSWSDDTIRVVLVDDSYEVDLASDEFLTDIPLSSQIVKSTDLTNKTTSAGVADATDVTFDVVQNGRVVKALVVYQENLDEASSKLVAYIDTAAGLPFTGNGASTTVQWDNGANKIFKL